MTEVFDWKARAEVAEKENRRIREVVLPLLQELNDHLPIGDGDQLIGVVEDSILMQVEEIEAVLEAGREGEWTWRGGVSDESPNPQ